MSLNTEHLKRTADTLAQALQALQRVDVSADPVGYDLYRNAAIKTFELSLESSGKLLRRALKSYAGSPQAVDALVFNDVLRLAGKHGLLDAAGVARWLAYRANRNTTAHDYGAGFAEETLKLLPGYLEDLRKLAARLQELFDAGT